MMAPPAMVDMALAICEPPCCSLMASPSETAPYTMRNPPRKVTHPETSVMICESICFYSLSPVRDAPWHRTFC